MAERRTYSKELIAEAKAIYEEHGPAEAARRLDVPRERVSGWAHRLGWATERKASLEAAVEAARASRTEKRERVLALFLANAERALERSFDATDAKAVYNLTYAATSATKSFALLAGEATSRSAVEGDPDAARERIKQRGVAAADELAARRAKHAA